MIIRKYPDIHNYLSLDKEVGIRLPTSLKNILPSISFPSIPSFKYFSYNPPSSSAYNKDHRPWHNHDLILQATPKNGDCGSAAFLLAERLNNALLFPISFSHRLQSFLYYIHNSLEIKSFFRADALNILFVNICVILL